jgi:hypothetical protein
MITMDFCNDLAEDDEDYDEEYGDEDDECIDLQGLDPSFMDLSSKFHYGPYHKRGVTKYQKSHYSEGGFTKGHWTKEEDVILSEAVKKNCGKNWKKIAESLPGRTDV